MIRQVMARRPHSQAGDRVRLMRIDQGWTHEDMSGAIFARYGSRYATSARTIWRVEAGHKPSVRKQFAIAQILGAVPSQLWDSGAPVGAMR